MQLVSNPMRLGYSLTRGCKVYIAVGMQQICEVAQQGQAIKRKVGGGSRSGDWGNAH